MENIKRVRKTEAAKGQVERTRELEAREIERILTEYKKRQLRELEAKSKLRTKVLIEQISNGFLIHMTRGDADNSFTGLLGLLDNKALSPDSQLVFAKTIREVMKEVVKWVERSGKNVEEKPFRNKASS
jgi:hypothetical protein